MKDKPIRYDPKEPYLMEEIFLQWKGQTKMTNLKDNELYVWHLWINNKIRLIVKEQE